MANYALMNPGIHHVGHVFSSPSLVEGIPQEVQNMVQLRFKTAIVANRVVYLGNVEKKDLEGVITQESDAMYKSAVNKFDLFADFRKVEVSVRDGDKIVELEEYADRLLQFKETKMHLINISQELEFLEETFLHKGVSHPAATCKTDYGIAWVNKLGCYLYDGQKVSNLLEKGGRQIIKESLWESFITDYSAIGYIPKKRQLIVIDSVNSQYGSGDRYLYDMVTQSWVKSGKTNIIQNPSFELAGGTPFLNWTEASGSGGSGATWTKADDQAYSGTYSARCVNDASQATSGTIKTDAFNLTPGKTYTLSWWGRFTTNPDPTLTFRNESQGTYLEDDMSFVGSPTYPDWDLFGDADTINTWHYYSLTFIVPSTYLADDNWKFTFFPTITSSNTTWIDKVSLIEEGNSNMTNVVIDWNGDLIYAVQPGQVLKWDDTSVSTNSFSFKTKDIDFGQPSTRKKIYKAYVSYKGDGSAVTVSYQTNGNTDAGSPFYRTTADGSSDGSNSDTTPLLDVGTNDWVLGELKPVSSISNVYSFQLIFDGTSAADFEVNDISIVYRLKSAG